MNTKHTVLFPLLAVAAGTTTALAQNSGSTTGPYEFTIGGSGSADGQLDDSSGGLDFSVGKYTSDAWMWSLRQTVNFVNPEDSGSAWNGSTRIAGDYHFGTSQWRPLLGANVGYIYGDNVNDSWAAGIEGGVKYYVHDRTFIYGRLEYAWLFDDTDDVDDTFDDGRFVWSVGVGFNF